jgi:hypothetical protein
VDRRIWYYISTLNLYYKLKTKFVDDSSLSPSEDIDEALIAYATSYTFLSLREYSDAQVWDKVFANSLVSAIEINRDASFINRTPNYNRQDDYVDDRGTLFPPRPFNTNR